VDLSGLASGRVAVVVKVPLGTLISEERRARMQAKARLLGDRAAQQRVLDYLDRMAQAAASRDGALVGAIMLDSLHRRSGPAFDGRDVGTAEPLSGQWMLILTLVLWLACFPAALVLIRRRRKAKLAAQ
jgi:hypothetical protein